MCSLGPRAQGYLREGTSTWAVAYLMGQALVLQLLVVVMSPRISAAMTDIAEVGSEVAAAADNAHQQKVTVDGAHHKGATAPTTRRQKMTVDGAHHKSATALTARWREMIIENAHHEGATAPTARRRETTVDGAHHEAAAAAGAQPKPMVQHQQPQLAKRGPTQTTQPLPMILIPVRQKRGGLTCIAPANKEEGRLASTFRNN
jgi:hypothetical protein